MNFPELRRRVALVCVIGLVLARVGFTQGTHIISGRVTDASGGVIVGAVVTVTGSDRRSRHTVSDGRGEFSIAGLPPGKFAVHVALQTFAPADVTVELSEAAPRSTVPVVLQPAPLFETLRVDGAGYAQPDATTGSKVPLPRRELPQSVSVLTRAQMNDQNMITPWDALSQVTGVTAIPNQGSRAGYFARGAALELQLDGAPSPRSIGGSQQFDLAIYDRVEVQRGPAGVLQGAGAFGGVVNLVRRRPSPQRSVSAFGGIGRWNNHHAEALVSGPLTGSVRGLAVVAATDRGFFYERARDRKWLGYGVLDWYPAPTTRLGVMLIRQHEGASGFSGLPTYTDGQFLSVPRSFNPNPDWNRTESDMTEMGFDIDHRFGPSWTLVGRVSRRSHDFMFRDGITSSGVDRASHTLAYTRRESTASEDSESADAYVNARFSALASTHQWLIGANVARFERVGRGVNSSHDASLTIRNISLASPPAVPEPAFVYRAGNAEDVLQSGLYTMLRTRLGARMSTALGGRWSNFKSRLRNVEPSVPTDWTIRAESAMEFTPHAGAVVDVTGALAFYASYSEIFVPQTAQSANGHVLDPIVGGQWEVGAKAEHRSGRLLASVAAFRIRDRNHAYPDPDNPGFFVPRGTADSRGWEVEVTGRVFGEWDLSAGYTRLETGYVTHESLAGEPLAYWYPKHSLKAWSSWRVPATVLNGLQVGMGLRATSSSASNRDTRDATGRITVSARRQRAYAVTDVTASYPLGKTLRVSAQVNNLFDLTYYSQLGTTSIFNWFGEPRNVSVFLRWQR